MNLPLRQPVTLAEFLAWEERQPLRYEFDGVGPVAMTGGTAAHAAIQANLAIAVGGRLRGGPCRFFGSDLKIKTAEDHIRYPDGFVVCSPVDRAATIISEPVVIFEVLSPSTGATDRIAKAREYQETPSVRRYVMLEQDGIGVTVYARSGDGWTHEILIADLSSRCRRSVSSSRLRSSMKASSSTLKKMVIHHRRASPAESCFGVMTCALADPPRAHEAFVRLDARTYSYHAGRRYNRFSAMPHAFILGGAGQAGRAIANVLLVSGWSVILAHRGRHPVPPDLLDRGAEAVRLDRDEPGALNRALADGADALIDVIAYGPEHARQLLQVQNAVGSLIVLSSSSVYRDERGRTLDEAADSGEAGRLLALPDEDLYPPTVGWTPWSVQRPFVLRHGCGGVARLSTGGELPGDRRLLLPMAGLGDRRTELARSVSGLAAYPCDLFDYRLQNVELARLQRQS